MSREQEVKTHQPRRRGPMGHGMQPGEKPKDFKKSIKKLMSYIGKYKAAIFVVMFFAACCRTENFRKSDHCIIGRSDGENSGNRKH